MTCGGKGLFYWFFTFTISYIGSFFRKNAGGEIAREVLMDARARKQDALSAYYDLFIRSACI